jgi:RHS repeat-associated protein
MVILASGVARAQADFEKGYQSYQSYHGTDFDTVNLANGNLILNIPLLSYQQRGSVPPVVISIRSNSTTFQSNPPFSNGPIDTKQFEVPSGVIGSPWGTPHVVISPGGLTWKEQRITLEKEQLSRFVAIDDSGATHSLGGNISNSTAPYIGNIKYSVDGSDLMLTAAASPLIIDRKGNVGGLVDPNGNAITLHGQCAKPAGSGQFYDPTLAPWEGYAYGTASAAYIVDSVGRTIPNPSYVPPVAAYSCLVDTDTSYYPAHPQTNPNCLSAEVGETYQFPGENGGTIPITFCYKKISVQATLPTASRSTITVNETWPVLTAAVLPNGTKWKFTYDKWGQVSIVTTPTGATVKYGYNGGSATATRLACGNPPGEIPVSGTPVWPFTNLMSSRSVTSRAVTVANPDGTSSTQTWKYASTIGSGWAGSPNSGTVTVTDPLNNKTTHTFTLLNGGAALGQPVCGPYETVVKFFQGGTTVLKEVDTTYQYSGVDNANPTNFSNYIAVGVVPTKVTTRLFPTSGNAQVRQDNFTYDSFGSYQDYKGTTYHFSFGQKLSATESDWGSGVAPTTPIRTSLFTNLWQSNGAYWAANLIDLPCLSTAFSGTYAGAQTGCTAPAPPSNQVSQNSFAYDQSPSPTSVRGNLTAVTRWLKSGTSPVSKTVYNTNGMPTQKIDPIGNTTVISYDGTGLYPNKITYPQTGTAHVEVPTYDPNTGDLLSHKDENQNITQFTYDSMRRPTHATYPDLGSESFTYNDATPPSYVFSKVLNSSSSTFTETGLADTLGRKVQTQINSDTEGIIYADTQYDMLGRVASQSNPYRSSADPTYGVTTFTYDALGRKTQQTQPDGRVQQWCYMGVAINAQTNCNTQLALTGGTASTGTWTDFQDESGNDWQRNFDGLGRLASVMEPNGVAATPSMQTTYTYDALGNLLTAGQKGNGTDTPRANRSFTYDSLSRLMTALNLESGTTSYTYDANNNMLTRTQPLVNAATGTETINSCYDALNRKTAEYTGSLVTNCKSSSQIATANLLAAYTYDTTSLGSANNSIGHLTDAIEYTSGTSVWERSPYHYDTMGRLLNEQQCALGSCTAPYSFAYTYDYSGDVLSTTNGIIAGSPITINYSYDSVARISTVTSVTPTTGIWASTSFPSTLYSAKEYGPAGLLSATYGSSGTKPMFLSRLYDNRQRVTDNTVSSSSTQATATITLACITPGCTPGNGVVTAVVGGVTAAASTTGTTLASLATNLATMINSADGMPVTATAASNVVTLTAIEYGKDGEVSLSTTASTGATFTSTASGAALGGDTNTTPYHYALGYAPNGNLATVTDTVIGNWTYTYDTLDRLVSAQSSTAGIVTPWGTYKTQCWTYDSFGNRTGEGEMTAATACPNPITGANHSVWAQYNTSNRLTGTSIVASYAYDAAGNVVNDGVNKYVYDLDGRICAVTTVAAGGVMTQYVYDAEGRRVARGTITTWPAAGAACSAPTSANGFSLAGAGAAIYLRGELGDQDTELDGTGVWRHTNVFVGGGLTATYDTGTTAKLSFNFSDWLGSKRLQSNFNGTTQLTWVSDPFGSYLKSTGSGTDATEQHFTGKERDTESGNDYFEARYYESGLGRWLSPDWATEPADIPYANFADPQSLNLYIYVGNNPLGMFDPNGHGWWSDFGGGVADSTYRPLVQMVAHPVDAVVGLGHAVAHPINTAIAAKNEIVITGKAVLAGDGRAIGVAVGTIGMALIPGAEEAEAGEDLSRISKISQIAKNAAQGAEGEAKVASELIAEGKTILGSHVGVQTGKGLRVVDHLVQDGDEIYAVEVKTGNATRNASQVAKDTLMEQKGGKIVGKNAPEHLRGQTVKLKTVVRNPQ